MADPSGRKALHKADIPGIVEYLRQEIGARDLAGNGMNRGDAENAE